MANSLHRMFVYGTLKKGQPNHFRLLDSANGVAKWLGAASLRLVKKHPLVVAGQYNVPALLDKEGEGKIVHGELLEVDNKMLQVLDKLEEHPQIYRRREVQCILDESKTNRDDVVTCQAYFLYDFRPELLSLPHLSSYADTSDKPFDRSVDRDDHSFIWWKGLKIDT